MRAMFGLVSILVCLGIIVVLMAMKGGMLDQLSKPNSATNTARREAAQIAGRDLDTGESAAMSAKVEAIDSPSGTNGILVINVTPGGSYDKFWGLKKGDTITEIGPLAVKGYVSSTGEAKDYLLDAYQRQQPLTIMRDGQKFTVPDRTGAAAAAASANAGKSAHGSRDSLQSQLDAIQSIPTR